METSPENSEEVLKGQHTLSSFLSGWRLDELDHYLISTDQVPERL
jgi:hypothetical protein